MTLDEIAAGRPRFEERFRLDGKVVIVTGASSGLGESFAGAIADVGGRLVLGARRAERLAEATRAITERGGEAIAVTADVSRVDDCARLVDQAMSAFGRVDVLVNNAGVASAIPATRESEAEFRNVVDVNLMGTYWMAQHCGRVMAPGSSIVNISSVLALTTANLPQAAYASSKAAVIGLTRDLAQQWSGRKGIRVNAVAPGFYETEMTAEYAPGYLDKTIAARVPVGRPGRLEECAAAVVFLASDAASYITGVTLPVDGGLLTT